MLIRRTGHRYRDVESGRTIDIWFPQSNSASKRGCLAEKVGLICSDFVAVTIDSFDSPPASTEDAYLRLHLLSERVAKPNQVNLDGLFGLLPNVAWTSAGPVLPAKVEALRDLVATEFHHLSVLCIDKLPRMADYVTPTGIRIADADRVRLGAHLAEGTTVMHEGFVNFNAGTLGESMVEGRITQGVVVGPNSDIGAGASIMGTLSGGGKHRTTIGQRSLLGANAGIGISLGDECIVEAGLYLTAGTKVKMPDGTVVSARQLSGQSRLLFRRNSQTGSVEAIPTDSSRWGGLNTTLHRND
ncbi:MAG: tetrahydrodipicolinate succinyltransferase [Gammaproteobacteria bacterium]|nr:tetrahydrodipicolinate succinyltransferase [Gammaproteobacteria bacterium]